MTFSEFHAAVRKIAGLDFFVTQVSAHEYGGADPLRLEFSAYIEGRPWMSAPTAEALLLKLVSPAETVESIDPLPGNAALVADVAPPPTFDTDIERPF